MFYFLQTVTAAESDIPVENSFRKERELDGNTHTESALRADPYSVGEGVGVFQVPRTMPTFVGYGLFQSSY